MTPWTVACQAPLVHGILQVSTGVGSHFFLQGIISTQGLNLVLVHCGQNLYHLSHQGSPEATSNIGDTGLIPGSGRSSREGSVNLLQYSCLGNLRLREACQARVHGVTKELDMI